MVIGDGSVGLGKWVENVVKSHQLSQLSHYPVGEGMALFHPWLLAWNFPLLSREPYPPCLLSWVRHLLGAQGLSGFPLPGPPSPNYQAMYPPPSLGELSAQGLGLP